MDTHNKILRRKVSFKIEIEETLKRELNIFIITALVTLFPFIFCLIIGIFEYNLIEIRNLLKSFFFKSDMLMAIISITTSSALINTFIKGYKLNFATIGCWIMIFICAIYFCTFNAEKVLCSRMIGMFILSIILSVLNIIIQIKRKVGCN